MIFNNCAQQEVSNQKILIKSKKQQVVIKLYKQNKVYSFKACHLIIHEHYSNSAIGFCNNFHIITQTYLCLPCKTSLFLFQAFLSAVELYSYQLWSSIHTSCWALFIPAVELYSYCQPFSSSSKAQGTSLTLQITKLERLKTRVQL